MCWGLPPQRQVGTALVGLALPRKLMEQIRTEANPLQQAEGRPVVSVIIPAYMTAPYIGATLASVMAQTFKDYEVVVVNDGSPDTDDLERQIEPYRHRLLYIRQEHRGPGASRNAGIRASQAPLIAFLDSDDLWEPEYLEVQVRALESDQTIDVIYPNAVFIGDIPEAGRKIMEFHPSEGEVNFESLVTRRCNVSYSVTARREAIVRAGMFDESLMSAEDFDLWIRVVKQGGRIAYHRRVLLRYRRRPGSLSSDLVRICQCVLLVFEKVQRTLPLAPQEREVLGRERGRVYAHLRLNEGKKALLQWDSARVAVDCLREANAFFRSPKIAMALVLLRLVPVVFLRAYSAYNRLLDLLVWSRFYLSRF
jgi:glycosyltransferase involved in cell wall biosynthesis